MTDAHSDDDVPSPTRPDGLWADDLHTSQRFRSDEYEVTTDGIVAFARTFDPQPFHLADEAAAGTFFDGLAASGWYTAAITMRLLTEAFPVATGIIGGGVDLAWPTPTRPGDVLHVEATIGDITWSSSRPNRARVTVDHRTLTADGQVRQQTSARLIAWRRPAAS